MRLLIVSQYFWPENFRINDLVQELSNRGHEMTVLTGYPNYPQGQIFRDFINSPNQFSLYGKVKVIRVPIYPRGSSSLSLLLNYISFAFTGCIMGPWKLRRQSFDLVFAYQLSPVTVGLPAAFFAWIKKAPMAMWVLDLWPDTLKAVGVIKSPRMLNFVGKLVAFIYARCDLVLCQSRSFIPKILELAGSSKSVVFFPSWAEQIFTPAVVSPAPEVPLRLDLFNVMFAGNLGEAQDFSCILDAAENLKHRSDIRWLIVGDGRLSDWLNSEIQMRGLGNNVITLGRYPVERMPEFFAHANAMLVTLANQEIFSMTIPGKLQSYLAAGLPVIAALNGEGRDLIIQANAGLTCESGNAVELTRVVGEMSLLSSDVLRNMGQSGLAFSRRMFDRKSIIDQLEKQLQSLCTLRNFTHGERC